MKKTTTVLTIVGVALGGVLFGVRPGEAEESSRYPYDPACPWGRLSNGKGMLVRCLSQDEATALPAATGPKAGASAAPAPTASAEAAPEDPQKVFTLRGILVTPDEGKLPTAEKKLALGKDKMLECLGKHGGLEKPDGEAHIRFLVSARGRAEGVSVQKRVAMSAAAADCIAHVVDRRLVGTPDAPMVGATAVVRLGKLKK